jgi:formiminoglutamate deiminase
VTDYWCELAWLGGDDVAAGAVVTVDGDHITAVEVDIASPPAGATRLVGVTLPGIANAHSHAFQRALRATTHSGPDSFWTWRTQMYDLAARLEPDTYRALARATFAEMVCAGITTVGEFHYLHHAPDGTPYADPNVMASALTDAAADAGVRLTLLDTCYLRGGVDTPVAGAQQRFADADADAWVARVDALADGPMRRVGAAIHSVRAVDPASAARVATWAHARGAPLHAHVSEQPAENAASVAAYGRTPTAVLADAGALDGCFTAVHAIHLDDDDVARLGGAGSTCCICPTTERDLADGVAPAARLRAAGAALALGSDSHAVIDPLEEARAVELDERLLSGVRGHHHAADLLRAATAAGQRALGWSDGGVLQPGAPADLVTIALDTVRLAGTPRAHLLDGVVFAASGCDVRHVVVAGRVVVRDGRHVTIDVPRALGDAIAAVRP